MSALDAGLRTGLEVITGSARLAVPVEAIDQLIEYDLAASLPLTWTWIGGMGIYLGKVLVSLTTNTDPMPPRAAHRATKGVLLEAQISGANARWVVEMASVGALVKVLPLARGGRPSAVPWITPAQTPDGRSIDWLSVEDLVRQLGGPSGVT